MYIVQSVNQSETINKLIGMNRQISWLVTRFMPAGSNIKLMMIRILNSKQLTPSLCVSWFPRRHPSITRKGVHLSTIAQLQDSSLQIQNWWWWALSFLNKHLPYVYPGSHLTIHPYPEKSTLDNNCTTSTLWFTNELGGMNPG